MQDCAAYNRERRYVCGHRGSRMKRLLFILVAADSRIFLGAALYCRRLSIATDHDRRRVREVVVETVAVAVCMGGGLAAVYGGDALRAYDQFGGTSA